MSQLLKNRNYLFLWLSQFISGIGDILYQAGIMVTVFAQTGSALQTAGILIAETLPPFLLGPVAGALVDRFSRRMVMFAMDLIRALLVGLLVLVVSGDTFNLWAIYLVVGGIAAASTFYLPARQAIIPSLVTPATLVTANSLILGATQATLAIGFALGGILVLQVGIVALIWINLATFVVAGALVLFIRPQVVGALAESESAQTAVSLWDSIREGVSYLRQHQIARPLFVMELMEHIPHGIWTAALMLVFVEQALGGDATDWGFQNGSFFGGMMLGAIVATAVSHRIANYPGWIIIFNAMLLSVATFLYALSPTILFSIIISFLVGPPFAFRDLAQDSLLQTTVSAAMLGRIYAMRNMFISINFMLGGLFFAWMADYANIRLVYLIGGGLYMGTAVYAATRKALRQSRIESQVHIIS